MGDRPLDARSSSTQSAGVGGTGPSVDIACGRRVGGDIIGSGVRVRLCDLELALGGGPGGGGGKGMPGSHLAVDNPQECECEGVSIAPVEAARLDAGGLTGESNIPACISWMGSTIIGCGLLWKVA